MGKVDSSKKVHHDFKQYKYLGIITAIYITFQLVSQITASKIAQIGMLSISAPILFFPITYILGDILTEVYGYAKARSVVWLVFMSSVIAAILYSIVVALPPAVGFDANEAYIKVLGQIPRIIIASLIATFAGSILNDYALAKMKIWTRGKHLWTRTIGSTLIGEGADTFLFFMIALYGVLPTQLLVSVMLSGWLIKVAIEVIMTPVTYYVVRKLKKAENEDHYDYNTNFNPLVIKPN